MDLTDHPSLQHLAKLLQVEFVKQIGECDISWPALEIKAQHLIQNLPITLGESLEITGAATAAQDFQHCHQQQALPGETNPRTIAIIWERLEEVDQIIRSSLISCGGMGFEHKQR